MPPKTFKHTGSQKAGWVYPTVSVVISTQFEKPEQLVLIAKDLLGGEQNDDVDVLFIVQVANSTVESQCQQFFAENLPQENVRVACFQEKGLARSRNRGIQLARGDVILLGDTDCRYPPDSIWKIQDAYRRHPDAGLITFKAVDRTSGTLIKRYWGTEFSHNWFSIMRVGSWEVSFRRDEVLKRGAWFDERFGLGSFWPSGAENIFMSDFLRRGGKGWFFPQTVVHTVPSNDQKMGCHINSSKGALLRRIWGWKGAVFGIPYLLRRYQEGLLQDSFPRSVYCLYRGWWKFPKTPAPAVGDSRAS